MTVIRKNDLGAFIARQSEDIAKLDLELTCGECGTVICDIQADDNLRSLVSVAEDHICPEE